MSEILIFGGTTEGRYLAEFCDRNGISADVSVVSEYGKELLTESACIHVNTEPMDSGKMIQFIRTHGIKLVVDATHPYARCATDNIKKACKVLGVRRIRCLRDTKDQSDSMERVGEQIICVPSVEAAVSFLENRTGNVLVTTGSNGLAAFAGMTGFRERGYVRVLPSLEAITKCEALGIEKSHLICMQGPFSEEMNIALIHQTGAAYLVTKETGAAGGFEEKMSAAAKCGITVVVVTQRPEQDGLSTEEVCRVLCRYSGRNAGEHSSCNFTVSLTGIGPGDVSQMTEAARRAVLESDVLFGAPRILNSVKPLIKGKEISLIPRYLPSDVEEWLDGGRHNNRYLQKAAILFSGDTGFYSGGKKMAEMLKMKGIPFQILPGISSVAYFAARLGTSWENAALYTAHGREFDPIPALKRGEDKLFLLLGGEDGAGELCRRLCESGLGSVCVSVGENLSYRNERIVTGTALKLAGTFFESLCLVLLEIKAEVDGEL